MKTFLKKIIFGTPVVRNFFSFAYRLTIAMKYLSARTSKVLFWLFTSKEITNFTYGLEPLNRAYLASFIAHVTGKDAGEILTYMDEIENDEGLKEHIRECTLSSREGFVADADVRFGKRAGWYAFVRATKPAVVIETGVEKGLGAAVLAAALMRNKEEGFVGYYYGTDIDPRAGYLLKGRYAAFGEILYGDSVESLRKLDRRIDLFINDSDHSAGYERMEYETVKDKLNRGAVLLGDNAHITDELYRFARSAGMSFLFFQEKPAGHWYPGGGIGAAWRPGP